MKEAIQVTALRAAVEAARQPGVGDASNYTRGLANGLIAALHIVTGEPVEYIERGNDLPPLADQIQAEVDKITARA